MELLYLYSVNAIFQLINILQKFLRKKIYNMLLKNPSLLICITLFIFISQFTTIYASAYLI